MALGKPVVAFGENGPLEIITHERDGLLAPPSGDDGDDLALAMKHLLQDDDLCGHLSEQARATVLAKFHIADSAQRILDIYREVLA